jgi:hypothetical protein
MSDKEAINRCSSDMVLFKHVGFEVLAVMAKK